MQGDCSTPGVCKNDGRHVGGTDTPTEFCSLLGSKMVLCGLSLVVSLGSCSQLDSAVTCSVA